MKSIQFGLLALIATGCSSSIPSAYRGTFRDVTTGAELVLEKNHGKLTTSDGRKLETDATGLTFDALNQAASGIYVLSDASNARFLDVHWIAPTPQSRQEDQQFAWYDTEYLRAAFDTKREDPVQVIGLTHCRNGKVQLNIPDKSWQLGCPEGANYYDLKRVAE